MASGIGVTASVALLKLPSLAVNTKPVPYSDAAGTWSVVTYTNASAACTKLLPDVTAADPANCSWSFVSVARAG